MTRDKEKQYSRLSLPHLVLSSSEFNDAHLTAAPDTNASSLSQSPSRMALPITPRFTNSGTANGSTLPPPTVSLSLASPRVEAAARDHGIGGADDRVWDEPISIGKPCLSAKKIRNEVAVPAPCIPTVTSPPMDNDDACVDGGLLEVASAEEGGSCIIPVSGSLSSPVPSHSFKKSHTKPGLADWTASAEKRRPVPSWSPLSGLPDSSSYGTSINPMKVVLLQSVDGGPTTGGDDGGPTTGEETTALNLNRDMQLLSEYEHSSSSLVTAEMYNHQVTAEMYNHQVTEERGQPFSAQYRFADSTGQLPTTMTIEVPAQAAPLSRSQLQSPLYSPMRSPAASGVVSAMETFLQVIDRCRTVSSTAGTVLHRLDDDMSRLDETYLPNFKRVLSDQTPDQQLSPLISVSRSTNIDRQRVPTTSRRVDESSHVFLSPTRLPPVPAFRPLHVNVHAYSHGELEVMGSHDDRDKSVPKARRRRQDRGHKNTKFDSSTRFHQSEQRSSSRERSGSALRASLSTQRSPIAFSFAVGSTHRMGIDAVEDRYRSRSALDSAGSRRETKRNGYKSRSP